jgi:hypothetical protein
MKMLSGRFFSRLGLLAGVVLLGALTHVASAQERRGPSFDCARASGDVETTICEDGLLSQYDREIAAAYRGAIARFSGVGRSQIVRDQQWFNETRAYYTGGRGMGTPEDLPQIMQSWARVLANMIPAPGAGIEGSWRRLVGGVDVKREGSLYSVEIFTASPEGARWICEVSGNGRIARDGSLTITAEGSEGWRIKISRVEQALSVETLPPDDNGDGFVVPFCGYNGTVDGNYLPSRA